MDEMNKKLDLFIDSFVTGVLTDPKLADLSAEEKGSYKQKLHDHFSKLILDTLFNRLSPEQLAEVEKVKNNQVALENKLEEYAASMPELARDIEERLNREFEAMKQSLNI